MFVECATTVFRRVFRHARRCGTPEKIKLVSFQFDVLLSFFFQHQCQPLRAIVIFDCSIVHGQVPLGGFATLQGMRGIQKFNIHKAFGGSHLLPAAHTW